MNSVKMGVNFIYVAVLGLVFCVTFVHSQSKAKYIVCTDPAYTEKCKKFEQRQDDNIKCDMLSNKFDCLVNNSEVTTFARVTYEEALTSKLSNSIYVVAEIHPTNVWDKNALAGTNFKNEESPIKHFESIVATSGRSLEVNSSLFMCGQNLRGAVIFGLFCKPGKMETEIVVVVKNTNIKSFKDLKDSNVCYPGFKDSNHLRYFANDFENAVLNSIEPDMCLIDNYPYVGKHIKGLNDFFNLSCRPGPWVNYDEIDNALKSTYQKLCYLCNVTENYGCSANHVNDPFKYSLDCFINKGNVAILSKDLATTLKSPLYLTANGTVSSEPYVWFEKPWPLILSNREHPAHILELSNDDETMIPVLQKSQTLRSFLTKTVNKSPVNPKCPKKLNWCTNSNLETEECELLRDVVSQQRIPMDIECVEKIDKLACINSVSQFETDMLTAQNTYGLIARSKNLEPIAYPGVNITVASKSMVVIRSEDKSINGFKDLKEKFGCFSQFGDIAFSSLFFVLKKQNLIKESCKLDELLVSFMGMSCIPGIIDPNLKTLPGDLDISKFCKCAGGPTSKTDVQCSASYDNEYYGNDGALKCLSEIGNYAVVTNYEIEGRLNDSKYSILCKNNVIKHFTDIKEDDDDCFLSVTSNQEIMIRNHDILHIDAVAMLADLEGLPKQYGFFGKMQNLMFKNSIPKLNFNMSEDKFVINYKNVFLGYDQCLEDNYYIKNAAIHTTQQLYILILPIVLSILFKLRCDNP